MLNLGKLCFQTSFISFYFFIRTHYSHGDQLFKWPFPPHSSFPKMSLILLLPAHLMQNFTAPIYGEMVEQHIRDELEDFQVRLYRIQMYKIVIPIFLLISLLAILANLVVIAALKSSKIQRNATIILTLSLTFSDIWTSFVVSLSLLYNSYFPIVLGAPVNPCISLTLELLRSGGMISATLHLLLIALHHFAGIHADRSQQAHSTRLVCLLAWIGPFSFLLLLSLSIPGQGYWNCQFVDFYHSRLFRISISLLLISTFLVIISCYIRLLFNLRSNRKRFFKNDALCGRRKSSIDKNRREMRTAITAILICVSFFLGWAPAAILFAITCRDCTLLRRESFRTIFLLSCTQLAFILGKSLLNPLIYSIRIPEVDSRIREFRQKIGQSFGNKISRLLSSQSIEES